MNVPRRIITTIAAFAMMSYLPLLGCQPSAGESSGNGNSPNRRSSKGASDGGSLQPDDLLGKWSRVDSKGGQYYLFAGDGFTATFDEPQQAEPLELPAAMRTGADRFVGKWNITNSELVLTHLSSPDSSKLIDEVRVSLKILDGDAGIEIDGKPYQRGSFDAP